jgi:hypothetical protein
MALGGFSVTGFPSTVAATYNAVLAAMRADGASLPTFVEWEELSAQDKALLVNLCAAVSAADREGTIARLKEFLAVLEAVVGASGEQSA